MALTAEAMEVRPKWPHISSTERKDYLSLNSAKITFGNEKVMGTFQMKRS